MSNERRCSDRVSFQEDLRPYCQLVHPYDDSLVFPARMLDIGTGGFCLIPEGRPTFPDWVMERTVRLRVVLPGWGFEGRIFRPSRVLRCRPHEDKQAAAFLWDPSAAETQTTEQNQAHSLQRYVLEKPCRGLELDALRAIQTVRGSADPLRVNQMADYLSAEQEAEEPAAAESDTVGDRMPDFLGL